MNKKTLKQKRFFHYVFLTILLFVFFAFFRSVSWVGSSDLHTAMEVATTTLSFLVGIIALITYYTNKKVIFLLVGVGFLGTSFLDGFHAVVTSGFFEERLASSLPSFIPWSWVSSRMFLSVSMVASLYYWNKERVRKIVKIKEIWVYTFFALFTMFSFIFFIYAPLPRAYYPELFFTRPGELVPASLFLVALWGYFVKGDWKHDLFEHWIILFLIVSFISQSLFMSFSLELFDFNFDMAHILKKVSYVFILTGLFSTIHYLFGKEKKEKRLLEEKNKELQSREEDSNELVRKLKSREKELGLSVKELEHTRKAMLNIMEDLDEEKKNLAVAKSRDDAILEGIGEGLVVTDTDRKVVLINKSGETILGMTQEKLLGKKWPDVISKRGDKPILDEEGNPVSPSSTPIHNAIEHKERFVENKFLYNRKKGGPIAVSITASPFVAQDEVLGAIIIFRDISHEREIDKAKTEFVSLASHQLRTPLSIINWYAEILLGGEEKNLTKEQRQYIQEIQTGNKRMVDLVNALLNVSRLELGTFTVEPEAINPTTLVDEILKEIEILASKKEIVVKEKFEDVKEMPIDRKLFQIVVQNLLSNAVKYTPEKGEVIASLSLAQKGDSVGSEIMKEDVLVFTVSDNGMGIPKKEQANIFQKLFRAENVKITDTQGTGLGLYIVKSIVEQTGGKIWFASEENKGTTFFVAIPKSGMKARKGSKKLD